ncbi:MAG: flavodoxin-dependent (E)-4-hydroxy-3-methylbut-2-enyl-diphosphate synthase [Candidatus Omnitrophota bacterium]
MYKIERRKTRTVKIGKIKIGSGHPVAVQSMVKVRAQNVAKSVEEIRKLEIAGCDIVRIAVEDEKDARALKDIKKRINIPLVADIHFDHRLALLAAEAGVDKIRLNPGNIYRVHEVRAVIAAAKNARIPIRIGANSGSLRIRSRDAAGALVASVVDYLKIFKKARFKDIVISLKGSDITDTITAYEKMASLCGYPLHVGMTATGLPLDGIVKSSVGIGILLFRGIGDTIRISLLDEPRQEVAVAKFLLNSLGLRNFGPELICCPACGRCEVDLLKKAQRFQEWLDKLPGAQSSKLKNLRIALMGCVVNGPGEAREADLGIAFSRHKGVLFKKGKIVGTVSLGRGEETLFAILKKGL